MTSSTLHRLTHPPAIPASSQILTFGAHVPWEALGLAVLGLMILLDQPCRLERMIRKLLIVAILIGLVLWFVPTLPGHPWWHHWWLALR